MRSGGVTALVKSSARVEVSQEAMHNTLSTLWRLDHLYLKPDQTDQSCPLSESEHIEHIGC